MQEEDLETLVAPSAPGSTSRASQRPRSSAPVSRLEVKVARDTAPGGTFTNTRAVEAEENERARAIVWVGAIVATISAIVIQIPPDVPSVSRIATTAGVLSISASSLGLIIADKLGRPITARNVFWLSMIVWAAILVVTWAIGPMSPVIMVIMFGVYYFGLSDAKWQGWVCYGVNAGGHLAVTLSYTLGMWGTHQPMFGPTSDNPAATYAMEIVSQAMLAMILWLARLSRSATLEAMVEIERAQRQLREREVLLDEVAQDLQIAIGAGKRGRLSGQIFGHYIAEDIIGRGAMGEVYRGRHRDDGKHAAVKVLHPFFSESQSHVDRFFREAEVTSALASPHIVAVLEHGVAESGEPFLTMELLEGHDLAWHLRQRRRFDIKDTLRLIDQLSRALAVVQDEGIIHRDLKPKNVFCDERGDEPVWKILDFGVSKMRSANATLTHGNIIGTPGYMAPEQATGGDVDHRADVFSLGAITYRVLTGRPPFGGDGSMAVLYRMTKEQPERPGAIVRLPSDVDLVLALALAKDPDRRIRSASTFAAVLRDATKGELDQRLRDDAHALIAELPWRTTA